MEVESIIDVAGDGVIPGPHNEYHKVLTFEDDSATTVIELAVLSNSHSKPSDQRMTYGILHDALKGLWDVMIRVRRERSVQYFEIFRAGKGAVGLGYTNYARRPGLP